MHKRQQLGKVVGYHLVVSGASEQVLFCATYEQLSAEYEKHVNTHRDIFVLIKNSYSELKLQKMPYNEVPQIDAALLSENSMHTVWRPATEKDVRNFHHNHRSES